MVEQLVVVPFLQIILNHVFANKWPMLKIEAGVEDVLLLSHSLFICLEMHFFDQITKFNLVSA